MSALQRYDNNNESRSQEGLGIFLETQVCKIMFNVIYREVDMHKWEYRIITVEDTWDGKFTHIKYIDGKLLNLRTEDLPKWNIAYLQELGALGWELVICQQNHTFYFKRPIEE